MRSKLAILAFALTATPAMAQSHQTATGEEVYKAAQAAVNGESNSYPMEVTTSADPSTGDRIFTFTFSGPSGEVNEIIAHCQIRLEKEIGFDRETGVVRSVVESVPICGDQYKSMRDMITVDEVQASFAVRQYVFQ